MFKKKDKREKKLYVQLSVEAGGEPRCEPWPAC